MSRSVNAWIAIAFLAMASAPAFAGNLTISNGRTTPADTNTGDGAGPGDITITGNGSVKVGGGPAVTLDSNNAVINQGTIQVTNDTGATGLLFEAGNSGSLTNSGTINALVLDSSNVATGSGNIAFYVSGNGAFIGNLSFTSTSTVEAGGTNSFGILLDSQVQGAIDLAGTLTAAGTGTTAFQSNALISGDLSIASGTNVTASGDGARGVLLAGGVNGAFANSGTITAAGAQNNVTYSGAVPRADFAVGIGASVTGGFNNIGTLSAVSASEALIISPALGTTYSDITLGIIDATATPYGFSNTGAITANTARSGETVTGIVIEGASDGVNDYGVTIDGGIQNTGSVTATASADGTAIGLRLGNHSVVPTIVNSGTITGSTGATNTGVAYGLLLDQGASLPSLTNSGTISANVAATDAYAFAIVDRSGTLLSLNNTGTISAVATTSGSGVTQSVAIDLSQAQGGITLTNGGKINGQVLLGDHDDTVALVADSDGNAATTSTWTGDLSFGAGADTFSISGAGIFTGGITKGAGTLAITVNDGVVALGSSSTVAATTIDFAADSKLTLVLDPTLAVSPRLDAAQSVTFANGATIEATLTQFVGTDFTAIVARAPTINASLAPGDLIFDNLPFLYAADTHLISAGEQELEIELHLKSAAELGFNANQAAFYGSMLDILSVADNTLETPLLAISDGTDFAKAYAMLMPATSQPTLHAALVTVDDLARNLQDRERIFLTGDPTFGGFNFWWTGSGHALSVDSSEMSTGMTGDLITTTFGLDGAFMPWAMFGGELTFGSAELYNGGSKDNTVNVDGSHGGVYATLSAGPLYVSGSAGAGETSNRSARIFKPADGASIESSWDGTFLDANGEVGINAVLWNAILRPWAGVSWLRLNDEAHHETGGGTGLDLNYDAVDVDVERAKAGVTLGYNVNYSDFTMTPELRAGWSQVLNDLPTDLRGSFVDGAVPFVLGLQPIPHDQVDAGFGLMLHGRGLAVALDYDATFADGETSHTGTLQISTEF